MPLASLAPGTPADLLLFDPELEWTVDAMEFASKGKNTPLDGTKLKGRVVATIASGIIVHQSRELGLQEADVSA